MYIDAIFDRATDLIDAGIWGDLSKTNLRRWHRNFTTDTERYFAACLLDQLIYRSKPQTVALAAHLFSRVLPDLNRLDPFPSGVQDWLSAIRQDPLENEVGIRIVPAVAQRRAGPSGEVIARLLRQRLHVHERLLIDPVDVRRAVEAGVRIIVCVDDFLGTGDRFQTTVAPLLQGVSAYAYVVFAPLVAHNHGVAHLRSVYPAVRIAAVEYLDDGAAIFAPGSRCFDDGVNTPAGAREYYLEMLKTKRIDASEAFGVGELALAYSFEHGTPMNSLPIFWSPANDDWSPLFDR